MILASLHELEKYSCLVPSSEAIKSFISKLNAASWPSAKINLNGEKLMAVFIEGNVPLNTEASLTMEAHEKYYDLHYVFSGSEIMAWKSINNCKNVERPYDSENDYILYKEVPESLFKVRQGHFAFLSPEDIHISAGAETAFKKVVFKILIP